MLPRYVDETDDGSGEGGNPIARAVYRYLYQNLHTSFSQYGYDTTLAQQVDDDFGSLLATDGIHPFSIYLSSANHVPQMSAYATETSGQAISSSLPRHGSEPPL